MEITFWDSFSLCSIINNSFTSTTKSRLKCFKDLVWSMSCLSGKSNLTRMKDGDDEVSRNEVVSINSCR